MPFDLVKFVLKAVDFCFVSFSSILEEWFFSGKNFQNNTYIGVRVVYYYQIII